MEPKTSFLSVDGVRIATQSYSPEGTGPRPVLCISHGLPPGPRDPSDAGYRPLAERFRDAGFIAVIFNFRGVGETGGNLDMEGWVRDLEAVLVHAMGLPGADTARVNLLGFSAGAAISINVGAHDRRVSAVAACACPARVNLPSLSPAAGPILRPPVSGTGAGRGRNTNGAGAGTEKAREALAHFRRIGLVRDPGFPPSLERWRAGFDALSAIDHVAAISPRPLLLVHGDRDELVPLRNAQLLFQRAGEPRELRVIPGAGHRLRHEPRAVEAALEWLVKVNGPG